MSKKLTLIKDKIHVEIRSLSRAIEYYIINKGDLAMLVRMEDQKDFLNTLLMDIKDLEASLEVDKELIEKCDQIKSTIAMWCAPGKAAC